MGVNSTDIKNLKEELELRDEFILRKQQREKSLIQFRFDLTVKMWEIREDFFTKRFDERKALMAAEKALYK
jgi:hypothetical protein